MNAHELDALYDAPAYTRPTTTPTTPPVPSSPSTPAALPPAAVWGALAEALAPRGLAGVQVQGDVMVVPVHGATGCHPVGDGVAVVGDDPTGHQHILTGEGVEWTDYRTFPSDFGHRLGALTVPPRTVGILVHTGHHDPLHIAPGAYELYRQLLNTDTGTVPAERYLLPDWVPTFGRGDGSSVFAGQRFWDAGC